MEEMIVLREMIALQQGEQITFTLVVLDKSGSMREFSEAPRQLVNDLIAGLKADQQDGHKHYFGLISFNDKMQVEIKIQPVSQIQPLEQYVAGGSTLLYKTVRNALAPLINLVLSLPRELRPNLKIVVAVITDGEDNLSDKAKYPPKLRLASKQALDLGFELLCYGIGVDGKNLAKQMGFLPAKAWNMPSQEASFCDASLSIQTHTCVGRGWKPNCQQPEQSDSNP